MGASPLRSSSEWYRVLVACGVKPSNAAIWSVVFGEVIRKNTFSLGEAEAPTFLGQTLHESGMLENLEENLRYVTPGGLMRTWPTRFKSLADELPFLRNPEALANKVYGGRMGNVNPGDGWRYRGSGLIQITGADNHRQVQKLTGIPVFDDPSLLRRPTAESLRVAIAWWEHNIPDGIMGDTKRVTKRVNGGTLSLAHRLHATAKAGEALG